jgi:predicted P-loop ATPase
MSTDPAPIDDKVVGLNDQRAKHSKKQKPKSDWPATSEDGEVIHKSQRNVEHFLRKIGCDLFHDTFSQRVMTIWRGETAPLDDAGFLRLYFAADSMGLRPSKEWLFDLILHMGQRAPRNLALEEIERTPWDRTPRLDGWLVRHGGGEDIPFARAAFVIAMVAAVRRLRKPGTKFDQIVTFEGPQGCGKSTLLRYLALRDEWFTDGLLIGSDAKQTIELASGKLIVELGELAGISKRDLNAVKAFASRQSDRARLAFGRFTSEVPRQFTIWGSTNDTEYLADPTGNRRFWPLKVSTIDLAQARADVVQLWAEAAELEARGYPLALPHDLQGAAADEQAARLISDSWEAAIVEKLDDHRTKTIRVRTGDILLAIGVAIDRQDRQAQMRVAGLMKRLGFEPTKLGQSRLAGWQKSGPAEPVMLVCDGVGHGLRIKGG